MNGMDMMVNAVLKATGFSREGFDDAIKTGKEKAADFEKRFEAMEARQIEILNMLRNLQQPQSIAHDADVDAASN